MKLEVNLAYLQLRTMVSLKHWPYDRPLPREQRARTQCDTRRSPDKAFKTTSPSISSRALAKRSEATCVKKNTSNSFTKQVFKRLDIYSVKVNEFISFFSAQLLNVSRNWVVYKRHASELNKNRLTKLSLLLLFTSLLSQ